MKTPARASCWEGSARSTKRAIPTFSSSTRIRASAKSTSASKGFCNEKTSPSFSSIRLARLTALLLSVLELQMVERSKELDQRNGHESRPSGCSYSVFCACFKGASLSPSHAQNVAELIRPSLDAHVNPIPTVLEIPSKDHPYDASKDSILRRAKGMFSAEDMK